MRTASLLCALVLAAAIPSMAHHSISGEYFTDQRTTVDGQVVQFLFRNPHSFVEVKSKDTIWSVEWSGAGRLGRENVNPDTLKPGDHVVITGQPSRTADDHRLHMLTITRPSDGWTWNRTPRY